MNTDIENKIKEAIQMFEPISLNQMDMVSFMRRMDTKFTFPVKDLPALLKNTSNHYFMLEIKDEREQIYKTTYFDTNDYLMYNLHHNGKLNRHKIRVRKYVYSNQEFLEVKRKNNKGETIKNRIQNDHTNFMSLNKCGSSQKFIRKHSPYNSEFLVPTLDNKFIRLTLVNKNFQERITLDYKLKFIDLTFNQEKTEDDICIAEIKTERDNRTASPFLEQMNKMRIKSTGFSKYCMGMAQLNPEVKNNVFKQKIRRFSKQ